MRIDAPLADPADVVPLAARTLPDLAERGVDVPRYDRDRLHPHIAHVGVGGFHRAHLARYTDELARAGGDWGIRGVGMLAADAAMGDALAAQDHCYSLIERGPDEADVCVVGSIVDFRLVAGDTDATAAVVGDPELRVLSMTVTEAGYADGSPTFAALGTALAARRDAGLGGVTILSCDNLPGNGRAAHRSMIAAASEADGGLADWIESHCSFPDSMVDRITPVTSDEDRAWLATTYGLADRWPVVAEPFRQWVVADEFVAGRPAWEDVGVQFSDDVGAWELYKLRVLNAGHSCLAYLAHLAGITYVDEAMATPEVCRFLDDLLYREAVPALDEIPGHPAAEYAATALGRFANTGVRDQIARLCIDGAAKFPTFLMPTIAHHLERDGPIERAALALAGWARYAATVPPEEQAFDASAPAVRERATAALDDPLAFLLLDDVFPATIAEHPRFRETFAAAWRRIVEHGPLAAMAR